MPSDSFLELCAEVEADCALPWHAERDHMLLLLIKDLPDNLPDKNLLGSGAE